MSLHALVGGAGRDAQSDPMQAARMGKCTASANSVLPTGPGPFVMGAQVPLLLRRTQAQFPLGSSKGWGGTGGGHKLIGEGARRGRGGCCCKSLSPHTGYAFVWPRPPSRRSCLGQEGEGRRRARRGPKKLHSLGAGANRPRQQLTVRYSGGPLLEGHCCVGRPGAAMPS